MMQKLTFHDHLISYIEDLHKLKDSSMVGEEIRGYMQTPF